MKTWIIETAIKTIRTAAQAAVGLIGGSAVVMSDVNWQVVASGTVLAAVMCILMNVTQIEKKEEV